MKKTCPWLFRVFFKGLFIYYTQFYILGDYLFHKTMEISGSRHWGNQDLFMERIGGLFFFSWRFLGTHFGGIKLDIPCIPRHPEPPPEVRYLDPPKKKPKHRTSGGIWMSRVWWFLGISPFFFVHEVWVGVMTQKWTVCTPKIRRVVM